MIRFTTEQVKILFSREIFRNELNRHPEEDARLHIRVELVHIHHGHLVLGELVHVVQQDPRERDETDPVERAEMKMVFRSLPTYLVSREYFVVHLRCSLGTGVVQSMSLMKLEYHEKQRNACGIIPTGGRVSLAVSDCTFRRNRSKTVPIRERPPNRPRRALRCYKVDRCNR